MPHAHRTWRHWLPFLNWPRPTGVLLQQEILAGVTVAMLMVPQAVAYAQLAGMPLVTGLYAAIAPTILGVLLGGSTRLTVGPTALTSLLVSASLTGLAEPGSPQWVQGAIWLALLSGLMQALLGLGGFGWLLNLISSPVMTGFTQAAALLIIGAQLPALLGLPKGVLERWQLGLAPDGQAAAFGLGTLALLWIARQRWPRFPAIMLVVVGAGLLSHFSGFDGAVIGNLPADLPSLTLPGWLGLEMLRGLILPAMMIALVSCLETASSARTEHQREGTLWNESQDLLGQGVAKLSAALSGTFPTSASFSRSAIYLQTGARSGWASLVTAAVVLLAVLLAPLLKDVPRAVLAAVVVIAVMGLVKPSALRRLWRTGRVEALTASATFVITLLSAPMIYWGVLAGVVLTLSHFLHARLHPRIIEIGLHPDGSMRDRHLWKLPPLAPHLFSLRMDAALDFATATSLERPITEHLGEHPDVRHVWLLAQPINRIDITGIETFGQIRRQLAARQVVLHISGIKLPVQTALERAGEWTLNEQLRAYRTDTEALQALRALAEN